MGWAGSLIACGFGGRLDRWAGTIVVLDAAGLSLFAVSGASKGMEFGVGVGQAVILAAVTAVGGGTIRGMLISWIPLVWRSELYAIPALAAALVVAVTHRLHMYGVPAVELPEAGPIVEARLMIGALTGIAGKVVYRGGAVKVGVVGVGAVGAAATMALLARGCAREIVLVDSNAARAKGVALDMAYGIPLLPAVDLMAGDAGDLADASLLTVTAGVNEAAGGATDRSDASGRLRLLDRNAAIYRELIPELVEAAPQATIMVVADPPDPLADLTRTLAGHDRVFSTGTVLDSRRFRVHLGEILQVLPADVRAMVVGEHGTSEVLLWSSAVVAGVPVLDILTQRGEPVATVREQVESEIRYANISIIEGIGASQYGIGVVVGRLAEAVLRDERALFTVAAYQHDYRVTLSLPSDLGADGVHHMHLPIMTDEEHEALERSAHALREARATI
ncbi:TRIC cation channel family protein [Kribbella sp. NPDC059898]|uniref:lactate/malate family dehydrogenase n=1 Tax=Kribbella sp. NPDC059898 TaxID=3346995 RepID=UPI00365B2275